MDVPMGDGLATVEPSQITAWFWPLFAAGEWEPATLAAISDILGPGTTFVDVGAWIGPTTLAAAATGARVHAYEPDPNALAELERNLALNPALAESVTVHPVALSDRDGQQRLASTVLGDSEASLLKVIGESAVVPTLDVSAAVAARHFQDATLIKVDIEGGEYVIVPRMRPFLRRRRPALLLSTHMDFLLQRYGQLPRLLRILLVTAQIVPRQLALLWRLRFYRQWWVERPEGWGRASRLGVAARLIVPGNHVLLMR